MGEVEDNPSTGDGLGGQGARSRSDFLRAVVATTPECIKVVASDGRLLQMNPAGLQMIEAPAWEGVDRASTFDLIAPEHQALWRHHHERVCQGETLTWEFDIIGLAGTRRQMETHAVPIELDDGGVGQLAITRDVSANKRTERALYEAKAALEDRVAERTRDLQDALARLQESERSFSLLVTSVTDYAIYMLDPEGRVVSWNTGAGRIKGYTAEEIIGQHFSRFYTEQDRLAGLPQAGLRTAARDGRLATEGWRVRKDGSRFWASVVIDAIQSDGALVGFAKITRDITEQKAAEAKLRQAQKMEAVGRFTGGAAHDFNNLLMAISASLELLRKRLPLDDERANGMLDNAMQGVRRGASLTQRMLAFARRQDLKPDIVDLAPLLGGMSDVLERALPPMVTLQFDIPAELPRVLTDAVQLEAALLNLVLNARDAMPAGGAITLRARQESTGTADDLTLGPFVCLCVSDTGDGMDEATLARATEPFFTTKGIGRGTGLGLSMVDGLAAQSGGHLSVQSEVGRGTTVELWLPVGGEDRLDQRTPAVSAAPEVKNDRVLLILVVDDDALVLNNTVAMLEDLGHKIIDAGSGAQALEILQTEPGIDLVITDHIMPGMTGLQLAETLKTRRPDLPVMLATGYAELPSDANPFARRLAKPFTQRELATALAELTSAKSARDWAAARPLLA